MSGNNTFSRRLIKPRSLRGQKGSVCLFVDSSFADAMPKRILITGCTKGLGRALVEGFIAGGHEVAGLGRSAAALEDLAKQFPGPHRFDQVDVSDDGAVAAYAAELFEREWCPDLLINNAAIINRSAPIWKVSDAEIESLLAINLKGVVSILRAFLPAMNQAGRGVVVNMSSGWGRSTSPEVAPYCMSKWGIEGLSRAVAQEVADGVAVIALNPGIIDTEMLRSCFGEGATGYDTPEVWAKRSVPIILNLGPADNGTSPSVR